MVFGSKTRLKTATDMPLFINGDIIERVSVFKYLGVSLDESLTFEAHIDYIHNKASRKLGALHKVREYMDQEIALKLYKSLVLPHFDYCDTVYMTATQVSLNKLQLLQNSACRALLLSARDSHVQDMHTALGLLYLHEHRCLHFSFQIHKTIYSNIDSSLQQYFVQSSQSGRTTRGTSQCNMDVVPVRSKMGEKALDHRGPRFWNSLPCYLRVTSVVFRTFKRGVSRLVHQFYGDHPT